MVKSEGYSMKINNVFLILQCIVMYLFQLPFALMLILARIPNINSSVISGLMLAGVILGALIIPVSITNIVLGFTTFVRKTVSSLKTTMVVKIILIPWYIINFLVCFLLIAGFLNPWLFLAAPIILSFLITITYIHLLATSITNVCYFIKYHIANKLSFDGLTIVGIIFHFIFCLDFIGAIILEQKYKRLEIKVNLI